jgi:hypothetical protein
MAPADVALTKEGPRSEAGQGTFTVTAPTDVSPSPGGETSVEIQVRRAGDFRGSVRLEFELPAGVAAEPGATTVAPEKNSVTLKLRAASDAIVGRAAVFIKAKTEGGVEARLQVSLQVAEKK